VEVTNGSGADGSVAIVAEVAEISSSLWLEVLKRNLAGSQSETLALVLLVTDLVVDSDRGVQTDIFFLATALVLGFLNELGVVRRFTLTSVAIFLSFGEDLVTGVDTDDRFSLARGMPTVFVDVVLSLFKLTTDVILLKTGHSPPLCLTGKLILVFVGKTATPNVLIPHLIFFRCKECDL